MKSWETHSTRLPISATPDSCSPRHVFQNPKKLAESAGLPRKGQRQCSEGLKGLKTWGSSSHDPLPLALP